MYVCMCVCVYIYETDVVERARGRGGKGREDREKLSNCFSERKIMSARTHARACMCALCANVC
jgi:hypothetical protein